MNKAEIIREMKSSKRYIDFDNAKFERQSYLSTLHFHEARMKFKIDSFMTPTVKMDFLSDEEFSRQFWACSGCDASDSGGGEGIGSRDTQQHIMVCPGFAEF